MKSNWLKNNWLILVTGLVIGIAALVLGAHGNPGNMGFCIACFERDIVGALGLHSAAAVQYAAQMMLGTAKMVLETNQHPGVLKDSVCSPAGSTIQGVRTLEERGMRAAVLDAVTVAYEKNVELKKASD